ncbi:MAG TPA: 50S ribosomal protein L25 [Candidatus Cloacimonetes bacterium]|nr:50S ribosomal protein L25 [Candidatus Cloacimonadota bacterium]HEX38409.1 50S ribosomal protein L25 [Candidatus Cloacimonadota bacterium]
MKIKAEKRETGKKATKQVRRDDKIPAILYGSELEATPIMVEYTDFFHYYKESLGHQSFIFIKLGKKEHRCLVRDMQVDPLTREIKHIDFLEVTAGQKIDVEIPIITVGDAPGVKEGGIVESGLRELQIRCLPKDLPEEIEIDVSELHIGDSIHIEDIQEKYPDVEFLQPANLTLVSVLVPKMEVEVPEEEEEELLEGEEAAEGEQPEEEAAAKEAEEKEE